MKIRSVRSIVLSVIVLAVSAVTVVASSASTINGLEFDLLIGSNTLKLLRDGRRIFRFDTFGDEAFWGDTLHLHQAIAGERFGGVGPGVSPATALAVGLKVDVDALTGALGQLVELGHAGVWNGPRLGWRREARG